MSDAVPSDDTRKFDVFLRALEREAPAERMAFLDAECAGDPLLRRWVEKELRKQTGSGISVSQTIITRPGVPSDDPAVSPEVAALLAALKPEEPGERIGPYKLLQQLGEGGFGTVWMAEQEKPMRREVALKILKPGMDSRQIIGRFEQERQALAMLDHPGIAKVFDAGATPTGRPFFAMELVRGKPITDYCDEVRLSTQQRLELFMRVCYAVQHAHQKGIIHRDLKPSNILVSDHEGVSVPKVIDLGLAKATLEMESEHTLVVTQAERMIGTPLYMSPEQAEGSADIDTRTDIYALGVVLYELLTGRTPHDPNEMARGSHDQIRRAIREQEPPSPSSALRAMSDGTLSAVAQLSGTDPAQLIRTVRGELDSICLKALEKDRRRRYSSAASLAADIQSYLLNEPISARPPSQWYRVRKFTARNRRTVVATASVVLAIVIGTFISVRETLRAKAAEQNALTARTEESRQRTWAEAQRTLAERERAAALLSEYVADIGLAQQSLNTGNLGRAVQLLERHRPQPGKTDLRGWAWRYLWKLAQGDEHASFPDHAGHMGPLAFSSSGNLLAIGGQQQTTIYDAPTRSLLTTLPQGADTLAFLASDQTLLTFSKGRLALWRTDNWTEQASWMEGPGSLVLSPDGTRMAVATREGVRIRDTATWQEMRFIAGARGPLAFSPDSKTLAAAGEAGVTLWPLDPDKEEPRLLAGSQGLFASAGKASFQASQPLLFAAKGAMLVAAENSPSERGVFFLRIWDARSGVELEALPGDPEQPEHTGAIASLAVSPDGNTLATTSLDHSARLWDLTKRRRIAVLGGHRAEVGGSAFSPDGRTLVTCDRAGQVKAWAVKREKTADFLPGVTRPLGFSADGRTLAALTREGEVGFYDGTSFKLQRKIPLEVTRPGHPPAVALSADFHTLAQGLGDGHVRLWDIESGKARTEQISDRMIDVVALTPDGSRLITGSRGELLRVRDLHVGTETRLPFSASRVEVSPDGRTLAAFMLPALPPDAPAPGSPAGAPPPDGATPPPPMPTFPSAGRADASVVLWDLAAGSERARLPMEIGMPLDIAFSPDGSAFATANADNAVRLWDAATGALRGVCTGHKQMVRAVAFSYDGKTLATASDDSTLRLWNLATQQELLSFEDLGSSMSGLLFSPDDTTLVVTRTNRMQTRGLLFRRAPRAPEPEEALNDRQP